MTKVLCDRRGRDGGVHVRDLKTKESISLEFEVLLHLLDKLKRHDFDGPLLPRSERASKKLTVKKCDCGKYFEVEYFFDRIGINSEAIEGLLASERMLKIFKAAIDSKN